MNATVNALALFGTVLYAGGQFTTAGGVGANYMARWNGSAWSALGNGKNGDLWTMAVIGADRYAGGQLTTAGGVRVNYIARWDRSAWSALGGGRIGTGAAL